jgi:hypothetical protein
MRKENILDEVCTQIKRHSKFDHEEQYDFNTLWAVGTYFVAYDDIRVFDHYPMLAFMSPEPDSGKTNALKVTSKLAFNATPPGSFTTASILRKIDRSDKLITICLDDLDTKFTHGKDNSDLVMLFNLGYERGALITRCSQNTDGLIETPAYCPKAFSGLKIAKIPGPTMTRTFVINMRPKTEDDVVLDGIDDASLEAVRKRIEEWAPTIVDQLKAVEIPADDISSIINRKRQLLKPLLALARVTSSEWYQRALNVARFFTEQQTEKTLTHKILFASYRVFREGEYPDRIHSHTLLEELYRLGIPEYVELSQLASHLSTYDIKPKQMKIKDQNRNGYEWRTFLKPFADYITNKEVEEVEIEIGIRAKVEEVDVVDAFRKPSLARPLVAYF